MSDQLILKYRPQVYADVLGQTEIADSVQDVVASGRSRTFLFSGPAGVGKTTFARLIAAQLGCDSQNIIEIDAASRTGIEDMREITSRLMYSVLGTSPFRMIILDECHALSKAAWQSLLKSVEEPPPNTYWCFCTTDVSKVPETIVSRCSAYQLKPLNTDNLFNLLMSVASQEGFTTPEDVLYFIAGESDGSPRIALQNLAKCSACQTVDQAATLLNTITTDSPEIVELCREILKGTSWKRAMDLLKKLNEPNPESIRRVVVAYFTKVAMDAKTGNTAESALAVLEAFGYSYQGETGIAPVLLSLGRLGLK